MSLRPPVTQPDIRYHNLTREARFGVVRRKHYLRVLQLRSYKGKFSGEAADGISADPPEVWRIVGPAAGFLNSSLCRPVVLEGQGNTGRVARGQTAQLNLP